MRLWLASICVCVLSACGPHIDQAAKAGVDQQVARLARSGQHYPAPTSSELLPRAPGQWVKSHVTDKDGNHSFVTSKVLSMDGDRTWLEVETESYSGSSAVKMLVALGDGKDLSNVDVYDYWIKHPNGRIEQFPSFMLGAMKPTLRNMLANIAVSHSPERQEDVSVPAGTFEQAYRAHVTLNALGTTFTSDAWWHPAVPLNGGVQSIGVDPIGKTELVSFGLTGAQSVFH
jgi:hypothetical protein